MPWIRAVIEVVSTPVRPWWQIMGAAPPHSQHPDRARDIEWNLPVAILVALNAQLVIAIGARIADRPREGRTIHVAHASARFPHVVSQHGRSSSLAYSVV